MRRLLLIGFPAWDTSRDTPQRNAQRTDPSSVSAAVRILGLVRSDSLRAKREATHAQLRRECLADLVFNSGKGETCDQ